MALTVQKLANILLYSWEIEKALGFHLQSGANLKACLADMKVVDAKFLGENLALLFRSVRELAAAEVGLKAPGHDESKPAVGEQVEG